MSLQPGGDLRTVGQHNRGRHCRKLKAAHPIQQEGLDDPLAVNVAVERTALTRRFLCG